jgi:hypothetical protein
MQSRLGIAVEWELAGHGYVCDRAGEASAKITPPEQRGLLLTDHLNSVTVAEGASLADRLEAAFDHRLRLRP